MCHTAYGLVSDWPSACNGNLKQLIWCSCSTELDKSRMLQTSALCYVPTFLELSFRSRDVHQAQWVSNIHLKRIRLSVLPAVRQATQIDHGELHIHKLTIVDISRDLNSNSSCLKISVGWAGKQKDKRANILRTCVFGCCKLVTIAFIEA